ncbi:MAG: sortase [Candidatus Taylorbacteria bacterium]|nr:sortase [Candidatus Taylorbacteria bacterium]
MLYNTDMSINEEGREQYTSGLFTPNEIYSGCLFIVSFPLIFLSLFTTLYVAGLIPDELTASTNDSSIEKVWSIPSEQAIRLEASSVSLNATIVNPESNNFDVLNEALKRGAVRYPGSGTVDKGNMFIFGHSSGLKYINNPNYKIFNNIQNFKQGELIKVSTENKTYTYKVTSVRLVDSTEALVEFSNDKRMLTLSTCDRFGAKSSRYVVEADFYSESQL